MAGIRLIPLLALAACTQGNNNAPQVAFTPADADAIHAVIAAQEAAWDRGDIPGFMDGYADTVCFIGSRGMTCGRNAVQSNYLERYPDVEAMGDLSFGISELVRVGSAHAWMTGTWELVRTNDTLGGGFTLLWVRGDEGWRIARDHTY